MRRAGPEADAREPTPGARRLARALLVAALAAGCYSPRLPECAVACGDGGGCPEGWRCERGLCLAPGTSLEACQAALPEGLVALYAFDEGEGDRVRDRARVLPGLDLRVLDPAASAWVPDGLSFTGAGLLSTDGSVAALVDAAAATDELSIAAWFVPAAELDEARLPARIVTSSIEPFAPPNFMLGQEVGGYEVRVKHAPGSSFSGTVQILDLASSATGLTHLVVTYAARGQLCAYLEGAPGACTGAQGDLSGWVGTYRLGVGNELNLERPWLGTIRRVAIYTRALAAEEVRADFLAGPEALAAPGR